MRDVFHFPDVWCTLMLCIITAVHFAVQFLWHCCFGAKLYWECSYLILILYDTVSIPIALKSKKRGLQMSCIVSWIR